MNLIVKTAHPVLRQLQIATLIFGIKKILCCFSAKERMYYRKLARHDPLMMMSQLGSTSRFCNTINEFTDMYYDGNVDNLLRAREMTTYYSKMMLRAFYTIFRSQNSLKDPGPFLKKYFLRKNIRPFMQHSDFLFGHYEFLDWEKTATILIAVSDGKAGALAIDILSNLPEPNVFTVAIQLDLCKPDELKDYLKECVIGAFDYYVTKN